MNKIVNGVANDYEFPMYYESNIKTSRDKDSVIAMTYLNQEKEIERLEKECDTYMKIATKKYNLINKAIEYIEDNICGGTISNGNELLKLLKGSDKE